MRQVDIDAVVRLARGAADELLRQASDPAADLTRAERRALVMIASAVDAEVMRRAGLEPRSAEAQAIIDRALATVLP